MFAESPKGHIVFDCDETLISSYQNVLSITKQVLSNHFKQDISVNEIRERFSADYKTFYSNWGLSLEEGEQLRKNWWEIASQGDHIYNVFPGMVNFLEQLIHDGFHLHIWTARDRSSTLEILKKENIIHYFLNFCCGDDPSPKPYSEGLKLMVGDIDKDLVVVVGDSEMDLKGAEIFGCHSIAATWGDGIDLSSLKKYKTSKFAKKPSECLGIIKEIFENK
ncbi:MAG: HAD-IA family hydrolase [Bdellovibrionales bacterium]|nr:HAD-IA family hydrolase [Bdellovibrionales bacterium]